MKINALILVLIFVFSSSAQSERYELGKRTRALEVELEKNTSPELRKKAMGEISKAVGKFFTFNLREAARDLDNGRFALQEETEAKKIWAESLFTLPEFRLLDKAASSVNINLSSLYQVIQTTPGNAKVRFSLISMDGKSVKSLAEFQIREVPQTNRVSLEKPNAGDFFLLTEIIVGKQVLATNRQIISVSDKLHERLRTLEANLAVSKAADWQAETAREHLKILQNLAQGKTLETDYRANDFLFQAEAFAGILSKYVIKDNQLTLTIPLKAGNQTSRFLIPKRYNGKRELPIVIALHGAGGSENLFFDSYGNGRIVNLCEKRGWFLAAPRNFGFNSGKLDEFIENLGKVYKIDRSQIFLIGHSMGSIQALNLAIQRPKTFAGVALISAGGSPKISEETKSLPFFIGTGTQDFSLTGSQNLHKNLTQSGVKRVEYKVYDDIEHLTAVQFSLNDTFAFFDDILTKR